MRRSAGLIIAATLGWLIILGGLAALAGGLGGATVSDHPRESSSAGVPSDGATSSSDASTTASPVGPSEPRLIGAGDIASCDLHDDSATAALIDALPGTVFTAGDNAYESGTAREYADCYDPTWGRFRDRTRPAAGNHDWLTRGAAGYLGYFGTRATSADGRTWYSYDLEDWHVIVLDSNCELVRGCGPESAQGTWLAADLAVSRARCTAAIWHHPRFSSGEHGGEPAVAPFWTALMAAGADVVINGHDHDYERFAPQDPDGNPDPDGIREFVVGTGGGELRDFRGTVANSLVRSSLTHGVLELALQPSGYAWRFISTDGSFSDQGAAACH